MRKRKPQPDNLVEKPAKAREEKTGKEKPLVSFVQDLPFTGTFTGIDLVAGEQYSILAAFNTGSTSGDLNTITIQGPGGVGIIRTP